MPRPKHVKVLTVAPGASEQARAEVWAGITAVLTLANHHQPITAQSPEFAQMLDRALTGIRDGESGVFVNLNATFACGLLNLTSVVRQGGMHLRRCADCGVWMLTKDKRRKFCTSDRCTQARARARVGAARRGERDAQKRARARVTAKGT